MFRVPCGRNFCLASLAIVLTCGCISPSAWGQTTADVQSKPTAPDADVAVAQALCNEIAGLSQRSALLAEAIRRNPDHAGARWHTGYVRAHGRWEPFDKVARRNAEDPTLAQYRDLRDRAAFTVGDQVRLASWCARHQLPQQRRAHLTKALELSPDDPDLRAELGYCRMNGVWVSTEELKQARTEAKQAAKELGRWKPELTRIRHGLESADATRRQESAKTLRAIKDPAAITSAEAVLSTHGESMAMQVVRWLDGLGSREAAVSLARHAVFVPWPKVRSEAAARLASRDFGDFVPPMLATLATPLQTRANIYHTPDGRILYQRILYREGQHQRNVTVMETAYHRLAAPGGDGQGAEARAQADIRRRQADFQVAALRQESFDREMNDRVCEALKTATGQELPRVPEYWWQWWNDYNEVYTPGEKPLQQTVYRERVPVSDPPPPVSTCECLAAGTPVWTDRGPMPIEQVQLGDLVLSKDPETGELAYQPVLRTTIRPPAPLVTIDAGGETIEASGGHLFWVSGRGWVRARILEPGTQLHGVTGTAEVRGVEPGEDEPTYNLIVADFHTYFAGEGKVLCHDNTLIEPTDAIVPGLLRR